MKAFAKMLSEETLSELKGKLGEDLTKQINDKLGDYAKIGFETALRKISFLQKVLLIIIFVIVLAVIKLFINNV